MDDDDLPSFDYLKRFKRPKVENETIGNSSTSVKKSWDVEVKSSIAKTCYKKTESFKQALSKTGKKQSPETSELPSTAGVKKNRKAKNKTSNTVQKKKPPEQNVTDPVSDKFTSTLTGVNPDIVDYKNLTPNQLQHLIRRLNNFYAHNWKRNKVKKGNRRNLRSNMRSNASSTFGKGQVGKSSESFLDSETAWKNYDSRLDSFYMYIRKKLTEKELEDEALNALLLQVDIPKNQKPEEENTTVVDSIDLTDYNEPKTIDLTNAFNNSVICLEDSDDENSDPEIKNGNSGDMDDSVQTIQNNTNIENHSSIEEIPCTSVEDSSKSLSELCDVSMSKPSLSKQDTSIYDSNTTGEPLSTVSTSDNRSTLLECPICFEDMITKQRGATKCGHVFCLECIQKSLKCSSKCPTCRKIVRKNSVIPLFY